MKKILTTIFMLLCSALAFAYSGDNSSQELGPSQASQIKTNTSSFSKNLTSADVNVQHALNTLDQLSVSGGSYWALVTGTQDLYNSNSGGVYIGGESVSPNAELEVAVSPQPSNLTAGISSVANSNGYTWGSTPQYYLYAENSSVPVYTPPLNFNFTEPPASNYDVSSGGTPNFNFGETGYTANGYDFNYTIWALYPNGQISYDGILGGDTGQDPNDGSTTYGVDVSGTSTPVAGDTGMYLVLCGGSNPNSGLYQVFSSPNFTDNGGGWGSSASYTPLLYQVGLSWSAAASPIDYYTVQNASTGTYFVTGGTSAVDDNLSWTSGTPTTTPTGQVHGIQDDGDATFESNIFNVGGVMYLWPISPSTGVLQSDGASPSNLSFGALSISGLTGAVNEEILLGAPGGGVQQDSRLLYNGSNLVLGEGSSTGQQAGLAIDRYIDPASSGTLNNYDVTLVSNLEFSFPVTITGFSGGVNGKILYVWNGNPVTYKNNNSGSSSGNRIRTPNGGDYAPNVGSISELQYDSQIDVWSFVNFDYTQIANTWTQNQTFSAVNLVTDTTTGTKIGTATGQKLGFFNATPVVQQSGDLLQAIKRLGLVSSSTINWTDFTGLIPGGTGINWQSMTGINTTSINWQNSIFNNIGINWTNFKDLGTQTANWYDINLITRTTQVTNGVFLSSQTTAPTIASNACGTTTQGVVTSGSTDEAGTVTVGTLVAGVTSCAITFGQTHTSAPASCSCSDESSVIALSPTRSNTAVTCTSAVSIASGLIDYMCKWTKQ